MYIRGYYMEIRIVIESIIMDNGTFVVNVSYVDVDGIYSNIGESISIESLLSISGDDDVLVYIENIIRNMVLNDIKNKSIMKTIKTSYNDLINSFVGRTFLVDVEDPSPEIPDDTPPEVPP